MGVVHGAPTPRFEGDDFVRYGEYAPDHEGVSYQQIGEAILPSSAADITFPNIPDTYRELRLDWALRSDQAANYDNVYIQINADTGSNYDWFYLKGLSNLVQGSTTIAAAGCYLGTIPAATAPANTAGMGRVRFPDYARTAWHKVSLSQSLAIGANVDGDVQLWLVESRWRNTAAITSLKLFALPGQLIAGSVATLWGVS